MEHLLHYVWKHKLFPLKPLFTTSGQMLEIIDPGLPNPDAGADFFNAKIKLDGVTWVGNVEIHERTSDWKRHHHDHDTAYDSVILHVASLIDADIFRTNGEPIPQFELHCPPQVIENYRDLPLTSHYPPCYRLIPQLPKLMIHSFLSTLQTERFEQKTRQIERRLKADGNDWEHTFFITLARNFGFGVNSDAFELWAQSIPLQAVNKHRDNLLQVEAFFFGQAGLLHELPTDDYTQSLIREYRFLSHKFQLTPSSNCRWKLLRMRPGNFPHVRIAQLACLYHRSQGLFSRLMERTTLQALRQEFKGGTSAYWETHYVFGEPSTSSPKTLSTTSIDLLIINTVIPFLYAYGKYKGDERLYQRADALLENLKPESNYIIRQWKECGLTAAHAGDSQALIQLKKNYCDPKKCLYCRIGYEYFKKEPLSPPSDKHPDANI